MSISGVLLTACGGGGGSNGGADQPQVPPPVSQPNPPATTNYTIGGTVSGLVGGGLVLQLNASGNLSVANNGSFVFSGAISSGASYNVTVLTQPTSPAQICALSNGSGTATANIANVNVTCVTAVASIGWSPSQQVDSPPGTTLELDAVADGNGNVLVTWAQSTGSGDRIWANWYRSATNAWDSPVRIDPESTAVDPSLDDSANPQAAIDSQGNAVVVWERTGYMIYANRFNAGTWGAAQLIGSGDSGGEAPKVASDGTGRALAVWAQTNNRNLRFSRFTGGVWSAAAPVEPTDGPDPATRPATLPNPPCEMRPALALVASGDGLVAWCQFRATPTASDDVLLVKPFDAASGTWRDATTVVAARGRSPDLAMNAAGDAVVTFVQYVSAFRESVGESHLERRFQTANVWSTPTFLETSGLLVSIEDPRVAMRGNENALIVWSQTSDTGGIPSADAPRRVWASGASTASWNWTSARTIDQEPATPSVHQPRVVFDADNNATVVWAQTDANRYTIWANRLLSGAAGFGTATQVESSLAGNATSPRVCALPDSRALAVWSQSAGTTQSTTDLERHVRASVLQ